MIDVIIPAYNAHRTIGRTLNSIASQVNKDDLKVYIINDGSDNDYSEFVNIYANILDIVEIDIVNSGPGVARQVGLDNSSNEYIIFIDADDLLYNNHSIMDLLSIIPKADVSQGYFIEKKEDKSRVLEPQYCYLHGKMFRRSVIERYNIAFDKSKRLCGDMYEDSSFNQLYLLCSSNIATTNEKVYVYEYNENSLTNKDVDAVNNLINYVYSMTWLAKEVKKRNLSNLHDIGWHFCIISYHCYFNYLLHPLECEFVFKEMKLIKKMYKEYITNISYDEQLRIYKLFNYPVIPNITFFDFMEKIL